MYYFRPTLLPIVEFQGKDEGFTTMRVTSPFGNRPDPLDKTPPIRTVFHGGLDIGNARQGDLVIAVAAGTVVAEGFLKEPWSMSTNRYPTGNYGGLMTVIRHEDGRVSIYAHMRETFLWAGDRVEAGTSVGEVGDTGSAQGAAHLHFGIQENGKDIDPLPLLQMKGKIMAYTDVPADSSFTAAIEWAREKGLLTGVGGGKFGYGQSLTREQAAAVFQRLYNLLKKEVTDG